MLVPAVDRLVLFLILVCELVERHLHGLEGLVLGMNEVEVGFEGEEALVVFGVAVNFAVFGFPVVEGVPHDGVVGRVVVRRVGLLHQIVSTKEENDGEVKRVFVFHEF